MRSISGTLNTAQQSASRVPYIYMLFTSAGGGTTHNYSSDQAGRRILLIDHHEEAYNDWAIIVLRNNDRTVPDLRGYWTEIGYGDYSVAGGNEYGSTPRLWVKQQQTVSAGGKLYDILELEGSWAKLRETLIRVGSPPFYIARTNPIRDSDYDLGSTSTVYDILGVLLTEAGFTLNALTEDDGIIDTYQPVFSINDRPFEYGAAILYRLLKMTKSYLRVKTSLAFEIKYPQADDAVNITYYSNQPYYFYEYASRASVLVPNHIYVFCNEGADELWTDIIAGEASNATEIARYADVIDIQVVPEITTQVDADNRAVAVLTRMNAEILAGRLVCHHDVRLELYDKIEIVDYRGV